MNEPINLGDGRTLTWNAFDGDPHSGCNITHTRPDGGPCHTHWCPIKGGAWARGFEDIEQWDVVSWNPLTLAPSILCRGCGDHGYVRDGKWVKA